MVDTRRSRIAQVAHVSADTRETIGRSGGSLGLRRRRLACSSWKREPPATFRNRD